VKNRRDEYHVLLGSIKLYVLVLSTDLDDTKYKISQHSSVQHLWVSKWSV